MNIAAVKASINFADVLESELGAPDRAGKWSCPFHRESSPSFGLTPGGTRARCWGCGWSGDVLDYFKARHGLSLRAAVERLGGSWSRSRPARPTMALPAPAPAPRRQLPAAWSDRAAEIAAQAEAALWAPEGAGALAYLQGRGFARDVLRRAHVGYLPEPLHDAAEVWGLEGKAVWTPRGISFPWRSGGRIVRMNVRQDDPGTGPKYIGPRGWTSCLYGQDLLPAPVAVVAEGELDALAVRQAAAGAVVAVATGSTTGGRAPDCRALLARCGAVLVAYDCDAAGREAARWWLRELPTTARRAEPWLHDCGAMPRRMLAVWLALALQGHGFEARDVFHERAAIREYEAGTPRPEAEALAAEDVAQWFGAAGIGEMNE